MTARIIDGKAHAAQLRAGLAEEVARLRAETGAVPGLAVILIGADPASEIYVRNKGIATREAGMASFEHRLPAETTEAELYALIDQLNADPAVDGILCQFPVPDHLSERDIVARIDPEKDVDGLSVVNAGRLASGQEAMVSCTPLGCLMLLRETLGELRGKRAVVIGRSNLVGKPVAALLLRDDCTVTIAHSRTADLPATVRDAEIVIAAVGRPGMVKAEWIAPGATVIDVGINRIPAPEKGEGKTRVVGDVDFDAVSQVAGAITPVPGGVGPMTIACLLANTLIAFCRRRGLTPPANLSV